jgi:hypothetical protein
MGLGITAPAIVRGDEEPRKDPAWVEAMSAVHARFKGRRGTFAHFGDSMTVSMAFWMPLQDKPKNLTPAGAAAHKCVDDYMVTDCWSRWKGYQFGNEGGRTIRWAEENVDAWLKLLNPEVALIMFPPNNQRQIELDEYRQKTRAVVRRCLENGTIVILNTLPPYSGLLNQTEKYAEVTAAVAREEKVPLVDLFGEVLRRRPDDWDGSLKKFSGTPGNPYEVPTLIARDGRHLSNPTRFFGDFSEEALNNNGYGLRSYLVLLEYHQVIEKVLDPPKARK